MTRYGCSWRVVAVVAVVEVVVKVVGGIKKTRNLDLQCRFRTMMGWSRINKSCRTCLAANGTTAITTGETTGTPLTKEEEGEGEGEKEIDVA